MVHEPHIRIAGTSTAGSRHPALTDTRRWLSFVVATAGVLLSLGVLDASSATASSRLPGGQSSRPAAGATNEYTPVTATALNSSSAPVLGTDGRWHVLYEVQLLNTRPQPATLQRFDVLDARDEGRVIATFSGADLQARLRTLSGPATNLQLGPDVARFVLIELAFERRTDIPRALSQRLRVMAVPKGGSEPEPFEYTTAGLRLDQSAPSLGRPLAGAGWVATNGCCATDAVHRVSLLAVNGALHAAQRYAIDWMRIDDRGRFVDGDPSDVHSYADYGADIFAVANGTVTETLDTLNDQVPGDLPDPRTITLQTIFGNHVVIRHRDGTYALYAHMQRGSVAVHVGDRVRTGQRLGKIGNSGNTSAPHLHLQITDGPWALGSSGLPFTFDHFRLQGHIDHVRWDTATTPEGRWDEELLPEPSPRRALLPLDLNVVDFGGDR